MSVTNCVYVYVWMWESMHMWKRKKGSHSPIKSALCIMAAKVTDSDKTKIITKRKVDIFFSLNHLSNLLQILFYCPVKIYLKYVIKEYARGVISSHIKYKLDKEKFFCIMSHLSSLLILIYISLQNMKGDVI